MSSEEDLKRYGTWGSYGLMGASSFSLITAGMLIACTYFLQEKPVGLGVGSKVIASFSIIISLTLLALAIVTLHLIDDIDTTS